MCPPIVVATGDATLKAVLPFFPGGGAAASCRFALALLLLVPAWPTQVLADPVRVAVASNFTAAAEEIVRAFEARTGHRVSLSPGSTGRHYAQIRLGAPFVVFLAADAERPRRLEEEGRALPGTRFTYAIGRLALWSRDPGRVDRAGRVLRSGHLRRLAIANPRLAPYGRAAREVMERLGVWERLQTHLVRGENVAQAFQYVASGNAEAGFVAWSQLRALPADRRGSTWRVPADLHGAIEQQAVLLREDPVGREFLDFLRGAEAASILADLGYDLP